jgi:hypothetical protein
LVWGSRELEGGLKRKGALLASVAKRRNCLKDIVYYKERKEGFGNDGWNERGIY